MGVRKTKPKKIEIKKHVWFDLNATIIFPEHSDYQKTVGEHLKQKKSSLQCKSSLSVAKSIKGILKKSFSSVSTRSSSVDKDNNSNKSCFDYSVSSHDDNPLQPNLSMQCRKKPLKGILKNKCVNFLESNNSVSHYGCRYSLEKCDENFVSGENVSPCSSLGICDSVTNLRLKSQPITFQNLKTNVLEKASFDSLMSSVSRLQISKVPVSDNHNSDSDIMCDNLRARLMNPNCVDEPEFEAWLEMNNNSQDWDENLTPNNEIVQQDEVFTADQKVSNILCDNLRIRSLESIDISKLKPCLDMNNNSQDWDKNLTHDNEKVQQDEVFTSDQNKKNVIEQGDSQNDALLDPDYSLPPAIFMATTAQSHCSIKSNPVTPGIESNNISKETINLDLVNGNNHSVISEYLNNVRKTCCEVLTCPVINCGMTFIDETLYRYHLSTLEHSQCNPTKTLINGTLPLLANFLCPSCGLTFAEESSCIDHMLTQDHLPLIPPVSFFVYTCPQCLSFFPSFLSAAQHMESSNHYITSFSFVDDQKSCHLSSPIPVPFRVMEELKSRCQKVGCDLLCEDCGLKLLSPLQLNSHLMEAHRVVSKCHQTSIDVFNSFLTHLACAECKQFIYSKTSPSQLYIHTDCPLQGPVLSLKATSLREFILRCGITDCNVATENDLELKTIVGLSISEPSLSDSCQSKLYQKKISMFRKKLNSNKVKIDKAVAVFCNEVSDLSSSSEKDLVNKAPESTNQFEASCSYDYNDTNTSHRLKKQGRRNKKRNEEEEDGSPSQNHNSGHSVEKRLPGKRGTSLKRKHNLSLLPDQKKKRKLSQIKDFNIESSDEGAAVKTDVFHQLSSSPSSSTKDGGYLSEEIHLPSECNSYAVDGNLLTQGESVSHESFGLWNLCSFAFDTSSSRQGPIVTESSDLAQNNDNLPSNHENSELSQAVQLEILKGIQNFRKCPCIRNKSNKGKGKGRKHTNNYKTPYKSSCNYCYFKLYHSTIIKNKDTKQTAIQLQQSCAETLRSTALVDPSLCLCLDGPFTFDVPSTSKEFLESAGLSKIMSPQMDHLAQMDRIIFADLENFMIFDLIIEPLLPASFVWGFISSRPGTPYHMETFFANRYPLYCALKCENCVHVSIDIGTSKDAADFAMCLTIAKVDDRLPTSIPFFIVSRDKGFKEVENQMKHSDRKGNVTDFEIWNSKTFYLKIKQPDDSSK
ncbi:E3 SUMO-protein ligase ZNF451 [Biomphalaria pfeifferi]|uniref:E3 SUMO-protein ligase ZNF451 n=1 Tax=Biomphalaria pfeifferi TaxID=112525 RepID=A0AAD8F562_BIOPF|nr:E3 SUMO-protein ligase ZNF451 [Biomphalaria pfeifferi]